MGLNNDVEIIEKRDYRKNLVCIMLLSVLYYSC